MSAVYLISVGMRMRLGISRPNRTTAENLYIISTELKAMILPLHISRSRTDDSVVMVQ